ncbi:hypothetical protein AMAG_06273 [Allomyces macrogynus ATCC 38327]|uniref:Chitin-binding type-4 domain-containing protein n=1 Tax=Allomyces macrogynus (strain ATCC 38327) TaxID=578462 RepID=A0A0L0SG10_ALLM3|nr:hypothetical protein AMAG_06273 [Allomyces macrogynus ATCC 38327]|eukprot:KNE61448.1 hypothetical protein AMAG_06273 [Allomyces macrogynus ATCC 38327]
MSSFMAVAFLLALLAPSVVVNGHMMMTNPAPRSSKTNPGPNNFIDYSYTAPLGTFPCKGYAPQASVKTVQAGSSLAVTVSGGATHGGGHCFFSLSYDGQTFVTLESIIRTCLAGPAGDFSFSVPIPSSAPAGKATFAWSWINAIGNREYYMNCADITIENPAGGGGALAGPKLFVANLPGYPQIGEFPNAGQDDGRALIAQVPTISVAGSGAPAAPAPPVLPVQVPVPVSSVPMAPSTTSAAVVGAEPTTVATPAPVSIPAATPDPALPIPPAPVPVPTLASPPPIPTPPTVPDAVPTFAIPVPVPPVRFPRPPRWPRNGHKGSVDYPVPNYPPMPTPRRGRPSTKPRNVPASSSKTVNTRCIDGEFRCADRGTKIGECFRNQITFLAVPPGTKCSTKATGSAILVWA